MSEDGDEQRYVVVEEDGEGLVAVGTFIAVAEARRFGRMCMKGAEGQFWEIAKFVLPEDYSEGNRPYSTHCTVKMDTAEQLAFFSGLLYQLLPAMDIGSCDEFFYNAAFQGGEHVVYLKKPLPHDVLKAFLALARHATGSITA